MCSLERFWNALFLSDRHKFCSNFWMLVLKYYCPYIHYNFHFFSLYVVWFLDILFNLFSEHICCTNGLSHFFIYIGYITTEFIYLLLLLLLSYVFHSLVLNLSSISHIFFLVGPLLISNNLIALSFFIVNSFVPVLDLTYL